MGCAPAADPILLGNVGGAKERKEKKGVLCTLEQGGSAGLFGTGSQPQCVALLAAKIGLEERRNVDWEQDPPGGSPEGCLAAKIGRADC